MPWWNVWGGGVKKRRFFPPKTSYKLGTGVKRGEQVGFFCVWSSIEVISWEKLASAEVNFKLSTMIHGENFYISYASADFQRDLKRQCHKIAISSFALGIKIN